MKTKLVNVLFCAALSALCVGLFAGISGSVAIAQKKDPVEHRLKVRKLGNNWKVVEGQDSTKTLVKVHAGDNIVWTAMGSVVVLKFPDKSLFDTDVEYIRDGTELSLTVSPKAKPGRYTYSAYCQADDEQAVGSSPPVIIVE